MFYTHYPSNINCKICLYNTVHTILFIVKASFICSNLKNYKAPHKPHEVCIQRHEKWMA